jgi:hypothetical protein
VEKGAEKGVEKMASPGGAEECDNASVMVIQSCGRSPERQGSEPALLGINSVRLKPVPDQLRFSAAITLRRLDGPRRCAVRRSKISKRPSNDLDRPPNLGLRWEPSRGGCALGIRLVAGDIGRQQDCEAGTDNGGVHRGR